jgi:hypothetical protein
MSVDVKPFHRVEITAMWADSRASKCPVPETKPPASTGAQDFVEELRSACYGSCPVYTVRVSANGE